MDTQQISFPMWQQALLHNTAMIHFDYSIVALAILFFVFGLVVCSKQDFTRPVGMFDANFPGWILFGTAICIAAFITGTVQGCDLFERTTAPQFCAASDIHSYISDSITIYMHSSDEKK